jgi:putative transcriptional regulator
MGNDRNADSRQPMKSRLAEAIIETAEDLRQMRIIDDVSYIQMTHRLVKPADRPKQELLSGHEIRLLRRNARVSQAVFASYLNVTPGYVSQLERGVKQPTGAALALLNVIKRKGFDVVQ